MPTNIFFRPVKKILSSTGVDYLWTPSGVSGTAWQSPAIDCEAAAGLLYPELTLTLAFQLAAAGTKWAGIEVWLAWSDVIDSGYTSRGITGAAGAWSPTGGVADNKLNLESLGVWLNPGSNSNEVPQVIGVAQVRKKYLVIVLVNNTAANHGSTATNQYGDIVFSHLQAQ